MARRARGGGVSDVPGLAWLDHSLLQWLIAAAVAATVAIAFSAGLTLVRVRVRAWASSTAGHLDDIVADALHATRRWFVLAIALGASTRVLTLPERAEDAVVSILAIAVILQAGLWLHTAIGSWLCHNLDGRASADAPGATTAAIIGFIARVVLWALVLLMMLDNLGFDITALVASLGIGGVAVALAVQNILGDVFASLAIALDKPVVIGDFIVVGDVMGTVERVGLKTTHLRSLSGELIVLSNADLLNSRIRNYKRMFERRVLFRFGVTYQTPADKLSAIPPLVRRLIEEESLARFDRAHFSAFGDSALEFEVVYFVRDPDYNRYMDVHQAINLKLIAALGKEGVEFAYPTQTIHLAAPAGAN